MKKNRKLEYDLKNYLRLILMIFLYIHGFQIGYAQQNVLITDNNVTNPDASSLLDLNSTTKGLLIPRVTLQSTTDGNTILLPAPSLLVYNTNVLITNGAGAGYYYNAGTSAAPNWQKILTGNNTGGEWKLLGNVGTNASTNFLGTKDNVDLVFRTNDIERIRTLASNGNVGIGTGNLTYGRLQVEGFGAVGSNTVATFRGSNTSQGIALITDWPGIYFNSYYNTAVKAMANSGFPAVIYTDQSIGGLVFGTTAVANTTADANVTNFSERMRITGDGNVGIGTSSPTNRLQVSATNYNPFGNATSNVLIEGSYGGGILMRDCAKFGGMYLINCGADMRFNMKSSAGANLDVMNLNEGGNVGIGNNSPAYRLDVAGGGRFGGGSNSSVYLAAGATAGAGGIEIFGFNNVGYIRFHDPSVTWRDIAINDAGGNVGVGTASPVSRLTVQTSTSNDGLYLTNGSRRIHMIPGNVVTGSWNSIVQANDNLILFSDGSEGNGNLVIAPWVGANTSRGIRIVGSSGNVGIGTANPGGQFELSLNEGRKPTSTSWTTTSDERLKTIHGEYAKGLDDILKLKTIVYNYKNVGERTFDPKVLREVAYGFSAQEVQKVFPECVGVDDDGYLNFNMHAINVAYVNAIKELNQKIQNMATENNSLLKKLETLQNEKTTMENDVEKLKAATAFELDKLKAEIEWIKATLPKAEKD